MLWTYTVVALFIWKMGWSNAAYAIHGLKLAKLSCGHEFCLSCIKMLKVEEHPRCAMCRAPIVGGRHKVIG